MTSPTQRSLAKALKDGWEAAVVEKWITIPGMPGGGIRRDMGGFADLILWKPLVGSPGSMLALSTSGVLAVQACAGSGHAAHRTKLLAEPRLRSWLASGGRCAIWSWRKLAVVKKDGKKGKARRYECREEELTEEDFLRAEAQLPGTQAAMKLMFHAAGKAKFSIQPGGPIPAGASIPRHLSSAAESRGENDSA